MNTLMSQYAVLRPTANMEMSDVYRFVVEGKNPEIIGIVTVRSLPGVI